MPSVRILKEFSEKLAETLDIPKFIYHDTGIAYDKEVILNHLSQMRACILSDDTRNRSVSAALTYMINGVEEFFEEKLEEAQECFQRVEKVCKEVENESKVQDILLSCRMQLFCRIVMSDYFWNEFCHKYVIGCECVEIVNRFMASSPVQVAIDDEFSPLLYPRVFGHSHLTRIPILRQLSRLYAYIWNVYGCCVDVKVSDGEPQSTMKQVKNTAVFKVPYIRKESAKGPSSSGRQLSRSNTREGRGGGQSRGERHARRLRLPRQKITKASKLEALRVAAVGCVCTGMLCAGMMDGRICVFDNRDVTSVEGDRPSLLATFKAPCGSSVSCLCCVADTLVTGHESGIVVVWDCSSISLLGTQLEVVTPDSETGGHTGAIRSVQYFAYPGLSPWDDSGPSATIVQRPHLLLTSSADTSIGIWDVSRCLNIRARSGYIESETNAADEFRFHSQGALETGGRSVEPFLELLGVLHESMTVNAAVLEWGSRGHGDGRTGVPPGHWDARRSALSVWLRVFTACGTGTWDRVIRVFTGPVDGGGCRQTGTLKGHEDHVHSLVSIPSKEWLVSASADRTLRLWNTVDLTAIGCIHPSLDVVAMTYHGTELYTNSSNRPGVVVVWDVETMEEKTQTRPLKRRLEEEEISCLCVYSGIMYCGTVGRNIHEIFV